MEFLVLIGVGVSCRILSLSFFLYVSFSGLITTAGEERAIFMLSFTCNYVVSVRRDFLFPLVLGISCVILLWHSLGLPYNYFDPSLGRNRTIECIMYFVLAIVNRFLLLFVFSILCL